MKRYSTEWKELVIQRMVPTQHIPIPELAADAGISDVILYTWHKQGSVEGIAVPADGINPEKWSWENMFAITLEATSLKEAAQAENCHHKGLYVKQIAPPGRRSACKPMQTVPPRQDKAQQEQTNKLGQEPRGKHKALAEAERPPTYANPVQFA